MLVTFRHSTMWLAHIDADSGLVQSLIFGKATVVDNKTPDVCCAAICPGQAVGDCSTTVRRYPPDLPGRSVRR